MFPFVKLLHCRAVFVWWAHRHVPTQYFKIYVAVHPISDVPVNCVPTKYLAPRYGTASKYMKTLKKQFKGGKSIR